MVKTLDTILVVSMPFAVVVCVGLWIYCLVNFIRKKRRKALIAGGCFFLIISVHMMLATILKSSVRRNLLSFLDEKNEPFTLSVEGRPVDQAQSDSLLSALRSVHPDRDVYHSHPTDRVSIQISNRTGQAIHLALGRDSGLPREYWVFQTDYETTSMNELGRVVTPLLDGLPQ